MWVVEENQAGLPLIGQAYITPQSHTARLNFLLPEAASLTGQLPAMLDILISDTAKLGARQLLASVPNNHILFEGLRRAGFSVCGSYTIWKIRQSELGWAAGEWETSLPTDEIGIRNLASAVTPTQLLAADPLPESPLTGWVTRLRGEVRAYAFARTGSTGIFLTLLVHPELRQVDARLKDLLLMLQPGDRPVYIAIGPHMEWVARALERLGAQAGDEMAILVRYMAVMERTPALRQALNQGTKSTIPLIRNT